VVEVEPEFKRPARKFHGMMPLSNIPKPGNPGTAGKGHRCKRLRDEMFEFAERDDYQ
jgi:hypothetical protein